MEILKISRNRWEATKPIHKRTIGSSYEVFLPTEQRWVEVRITDVEVSPSYGVLTVGKPWEGWCKKKPWDYKVTAAIPCLNTYETLSICIELLRMQTVKPFIMPIDTGSIDPIFDKIQKFRSEDVEVHSIRLNGCRHPSDYPAMA